MSGDVGFYNSIVSFKIRTRHAKSTISKTKFDQESLEACEWHASIAKVVEVHEFIKVIFIVHKLLYLNDIRFLTKELRFRRNFEWSHVANETNNMTKPFLYKNIVKQKEVQ